MDKFPSRERSAAATLEPRVTAIVVARAVAANATGQSTLDLCLRSALSEPWVDDLVIVDQANAPAVSSALRALQLDRRDVRVVAADARMSAPAAANLGAAQARGRWLLFLDSDVVLQRGAVQRMATSAGGAATPWIVGGRLTDLEGREKRAARGGALNTFSALAVAMGLPGVKRTRRKAKSMKPSAAAHVASAPSSFMLM
ncbi:MAG TPA: glycosyltransferase family A protein, partial [Verrucomicrobiae bacterium]|nr:glycosyltransferase family A protein [Verrucomicrobiae bacterium]